MQNALLLKNILKILFPVMLLMLYCCFFTIEDCKMHLKTYIFNINTLIGILIGITIIKIYN
jgi:HKD family nuclease